jgi:carbon-monoxide dehydrogenase medium subunit
MSTISFQRPNTVTEAVALLAADEDARALAGGASLVAMMNARLVAPKVIVSLREIPELSGIRRLASGGVRIGAMTRHCQTSVEPHLRGTLRCIRQAALAIASPPVRNMGTMGGSISLADPAADYPAALVAAQACVEIAGPSGRRVVDAADFFVDWYSTALGAGEMVTAITLPAAKAGKGCYSKLARVSGDFAIASVALCVEENGRVRAAVGGCGPRPIQSEEANALLEGHLLDEATLQSAGKVLEALADPVDDVRATATYRRAVIPRLLQRAVRALATEPQDSA